MKSAFIVAGMAFGDCGKGSITDSLVRQVGAKLVVRYNGGPQAAHHVVLDDGRWHAFHQFGSGMFAGARTHLSRFMLIEPFAMHHEAKALSQLGIVHPWGRLSVDPRCLIITPYHQAMNRLRELARGDGRHGSCGMGLGEAVSDLIDGMAALRVGSLANDSKTRTTLDHIRERKERAASMYARSILDSQLGKPLYALLCDKGSSLSYTKKYHYLSTLLTLRYDDDMLYSADGPVVFEGAQGVLLDETHGFQPYTTWSTTTFDHALGLCREVDCREVTKIGVLRSYFTRHGAGPFPTENLAWDSFDERHNATGDWQGRVRKGAFDLALVKYAIDVCEGLDTLALTHLDLVSNNWPVCERHIGHGKNVAEIVRNAEPIYRESGLDDAQTFVDYVADALKVPVSIQSFGPTASAKRYAGSFETISA